MRWTGAHTWVLALAVLLTVRILAPTDLSTPNEEYPPHDTVMAVWVLDEGQPRAKTWRYTTLTEQHQQVYLYIQSDTIMPTLGDRLMVKTRIRPGGQTGRFNYARYLLTQGIVGTGWVGKNRWIIIDHQPIRGWKATAQRWQRDLWNRYRAMGIQDNELGILGALTLGYREELDRGVKESFSKAGAMHVLAVSGLHTGIVWGLILSLLTLGGHIRPLYAQRFPRWLITTAGITALWLYAAITGMSPSVVRSAVMVSVLELSTLLARPQTGLNTLAAAAVLILLVRPMDLYSVSMQLSFAAMVPLVVVLPRWQTRMIMPHGVPRYISELVIVSIAAQLGTLPLTMYYFGQVSNYFVLTNLIVLPLAGIAMPLGLIALALSSTPIGVYVGHLAEGVVRIMRVGVEWVEQLPGSTTQLSIGTWSVLWLYGAIVMGCLMMRSQRVAWGWLAGVMTCVLLAIVMNR